MGLRDEKEGSDLRVSLQGKTGQRCPEQEWKLEEKKEAKGEESGCPAFLSGRLDTTWKVHASSSLSKVFPMALPNWLHVSM